MTNERILRLATTRLAEVEFKSISCMLDDGYEYDCAVSKLTKKDLWRCYGPGHEELSKEDKEEMEKIWAELAKEEISWRFPDWTMPD